MDLVRELVIAFGMAVLAAWFLELFKPGRLTRALVWTVSRLVPHEIRQDHYSDWCSEVEGIRADPQRKGPFGAARFALGQVPFAMHLAEATRRLKRAGDPHYVPLWRWTLLFLSIPGVPLPVIPIVAAIGIENLANGNLTTGLVMLGVAAWQAAGAWYILSGAIALGIPVTLSHKKPSLSK